jgi:microcystin-dependent protein
MLDWPVTSSYPNGYLRADGTAVSRTSYADLFALIGTTYCVGDNSTTFNLPNLVAAGSGSPVKIIKASLGGTIEPSTVAHASSHAAGGSDPVSIKQSQINDFVFTTEAARDAAITSPTEGMRAYITAPTIPAATGQTTAVPTGIQTIYNGSSWVCVTEVGAYNGAFGSTSSASYTTTLSGSPGTNISATLSTGTTAIVSITALIYSVTTAFDSYMGVTISGATTAVPVDGQSCYVNSLGGVTSTRTIIYTGLTAGTNTFTAQYKTAGSTANFGWRAITVKGVA